ncbi:MAG: alanine racemase [Treponema sp.]|jgi:D-serine deaminase-like pyridoxal phosphate-dependent protein|nr:alanine racemase [Treponema sp.]
MDYRSTPSVRVDMDIAERNIRNAVAVLAPVGISHRPHIKVHKSASLARLQQKLGCRGVTCAKLGEAEVMADNGINDILVAYPLIGADKLERYRALLLRPNMQIRTVINSLQGAQGLSDLGLALGRRLPVLIELDGGIKRGGLPNGEALVAFGRVAKDLPGLYIEGVEYYGGGIYACKSRDEVRLCARHERDEILAAAETLRSLGMDIRILSGGSSFSMFFPEELAGLCEVRAGNYIFNDCARLGLGLVGVEDCALRIYSTVVARPDGETAIIDAGSKTLTTDTVRSREGYGYVVEAPNAIIYKLNEEHGFVKQDGGLSWEIGRTVAVIPNHACTVPNLCDEIYAMRGETFEGPLRIEARGRNR